MNHKGKGLVWDRMLGAERTFTVSGGGSGKAVFTHPTANHRVSVHITKAIKNVFYFCN